MPTAEEMEALQIEGTVEANRIVQAEGLSVASGARSENGSARGSRILPVAAEEEAVFTPASKAVLKQPPTDKSAPEAVFAEASSAEVAAEEESIVAPASKVA